MKCTLHFLFKLREMSYIMERDMREKRDVHEIEYFHGSAWINFVVTKANCHLTPPTLFQLLQNACFCTLKQHKMQHASHFPFLIFYLILFPHFIKRKEFNIQKEDRAASILVPALISLSFPHNWSKTSKFLWISHH